MWIATNFGWFSVVEDRNDSDMVFIRGRSIEHMDHLTDYTDKIIDRNIELIEMISADYRYRIHISKEEFKSLMALVIDDINYDNFKNSIKSPKYKHALMGVWRIISDTFYPG